MRHGPPDPTLPRGFPDRYNRQSLPKTRGAGAPGARPALSISPVRGSALLELGDAVDGLLVLLAGVLGEAVLHQIGVLAGVLVEAPQHADALEPAGAEEQLGRQVALAHFQGDARPPVARQLADQLGDHLRADALAPVA